MAEWLPESRPDWWDDIRRFARNPAGAILGIALSFVVGGLLDILEVVVDTVLLVFYGDETTLGVAGVPVLIAEVLIGAFAEPVGIIFGAIFGFNRAIINAVNASNSLLSPVIATALWLGWFYVLIKLVVLVIELLSPRLAALLPGWIR